MALKSPPLSPRVSFALPSEAERKKALIAKQKAPVVEDLRPSDLLIERFQGETSELANVHGEALTSLLCIIGWKDITKQFTAYLQGVADVQANTAASYQKLGQVIKVPFTSKGGSQLLGQGGIQGMSMSCRGCQVSGMLIDCVLSSFQKSSRTFVKKRPM